MRKAFGLASLAVLTVAVLGGCTSPPLVSQGRGTAAPSATKQRAQPRAVGYPPCSAADLTGSVGIWGVGTGRISQAVIFTNRGDPVCGIYASTFGVPADSLGACKAAQLGAALEGSSEPGTSGTALGTLYVWDESGRACTLTGPVIVAGLDHAGRAVTTRARFTIAPGSPPLSPDGSAPGKHGRTPAQEVAATLLLIGNPTLACRAHPTDPVAWRITLASGGSTTASNASAASGPALTRRGGLTTCGNRLAGQSPILIAPS